MRPDGPGIKATGSLVARANSEEWERLGCAARQVVCGGEVMP